MKKTRGFFDSIFWKIFLEKRVENTFSFAFTLGVNSLAALSEGISFCLILFAFTALNGDIFSKLQRFPDLRLYLSSHFTSQQLFLFLIIAAILCQILRSALCYICQKFITLMSVHFQIAMGKRIYQQIFSLSFSFINRYKPGDLVEAVQTPAKIYPVLDAINRILVCVLNMIALVVVIFFISPAMSGILLGLFVVVYAAQKTVFKKITSKSDYLTKELGLPPARLRVSVFEKVQKQS